MRDDYPTRFLTRIYYSHYRENQYLRSEIWQIMWVSLLEAAKRYERYKSPKKFETYAEDVITKDVGEWMRENNRYSYQYVPLDKPFRDSKDTILSTFLKAENTFCPLELYDFISRLSFIKYIICKSYILRYCDEEITEWLNITGEQLEEIKIELQQDFIHGYLI